MGNCLQALFRSNRSTLRHETLLNYKQLTGMIKPSTHHDPLFYSSSNLSMVEQFLNQFKAETQANAQFVNKNLNILYAFIQDLKDKSSPIGRQFMQDQQRANAYLAKQVSDKVENKREIKLSDLIILRIEIQIILTSVALQEVLENSNEWDLVLEIEQEQTQSLTFQSNNKEEDDQRTELIKMIKIGANEGNNHNSPTKKECYTDKSLKKTQKTGQSSNMAKNQESFQQNIQNSRKYTERIKKQYEKQGKQLQEISIFDFSSKVVLQTSKIHFNLYKMKRKRTITKIQCPSSPDKLNQRGRTPNKNTIQKDKVLIGYTTLSVSDFIYYNSLMVSDVVPLQSPTMLKSSITTTASHTINSCTIAFISLRGQGLRAETIDKDYIRIIKQHQTVARQLQMCLQGDKAWEKLSQFRQSNGSQRNQSLYSEYSAPQYGTLRYKM